MSRLISRFRQDDSAATAIEYTLIAAFLSIAIVAAFPAITEAVSATLTGIGKNLVVN